MANDYRDQNDVLADATDIAERDEVFHDACFYCGALDESGRGICEPCAEREGQSTQKI